MTTREKLLTYATLVCAGVGIGQTLLILQLAYSWGQNTLPMLEHCQGVLERHPEEQRK